MYTFRDAKKAEVDETAEFIARVISSSVDASPDQKTLFIANTRKNLALWTEAPAQSFHLLAFAGPELAGCVLVRDFWNLCHLFVGPHHQSRGLGRELLERALTGCAGKSPRGVVRLNSSRNAVGFYRRMGFTEAASSAMLHGATAFERPV